MHPLNWGRCPQTPGIYRLLARMITEAARCRLRPFRLLSRRSGCVPAVPYPPLRSFQSGLLQPRRAMIYQRTATTPLTRCLTPGVHFNRPPNGPREYITKERSWLGVGEACRSEEAG